MEWFWFGFWAFIGAGAAAIAWALFCLIVLTVIGAFVTQRRR